MPGQRADCLVHSDIMETAAQGNCLRQQQPLVDERRRSFIKKFFFFKYGSLNDGRKVNAGGILTCFIHLLPETRFSFFKLGGKPFIYI